MAEANTLHPAAAEVGHERSDLSPKRISLFAVGLAVLIIVALLVCYGLMLWLLRSEARRAEPPSRFAVTPAPMAGPQLAIEPGRALKAMRHQEQSRLTSYGWIDQEKGTVHIPIERAMEILAEKGLPARQNKQQATGNSRSAKELDSRRREPQS
jgi:hypothetical protein